MRRTSYSEHRRLPLNIAAGNAKATDGNRRRYFEIARGSALEWRGNSGCSRSMRWRTGMPIGMADSLVLERRGILLTCNRKHFERVAGSKLGRIDTKL